MTTLSRLDAPLPLVIGNKGMNMDLMQDEHNPRRLKDLMDALHANFTFEEIETWDVSNEIEQYAASKRRGEHTHNPELSVEEQLERACTVVSIPLEDVPPYLGDVYILVKSLAAWRLEIGK